jgi:hypothetical protein
MQRGEPQRGELHRDFRLFFDRALHAISRQAHRQCERAHRDEGKVHGD